MPDTKPSRILFCTDFSDNAREAFRHALDEVARRPGSELCLLHVLPEPEATFWKQYVYQVGDQLDQQAKEEFDRKVAEEYASRVPPGIPFRPLFRIGKAEQEIIRAADELQVDLIVMGRQGRGALQSLFYGSVASKVVQKSKCAVLVIPLGATISTP